MTVTSADYSDASYAQGKNDNHLYPDSAPILHRPGFQYDPIIRLRDGRLMASGFDAEDIKTGGFQATAELESGAELVFRVRAAASGCFRLQLGTADTTFAETSDMLVQPGPTPPEHGLVLIDQAEAWQLRLGGHRLVLSKGTFGMELIDEQGQRIFAIETERHAGQMYGGPIGLRLNPEGQRHLYMGWRIQNGERFFGLGEKWHSCEKSGISCTVNINETAGSNTTDLAYKAVPVLFSTRGWSLLLHSYRRSRWEIGSFSHVAGICLLEDDQLDLFLSTAASMKGLQQRYTALTGRPSMPPKWAFGTWVSRCQYDRAEAAEWAMRGMRERHIPADVIHLDPMWMHVHWYWKIGVDACDFVWNDDGFPEHRQLFERWRADGWDISLWINPYLPESEPIYAEARDADYLLKKTDGSIARLSHGELVGMVDFTNPAARAWWQEKCEQVLREGGSVLKPDYGDRVPEDVVGHDGSSGRDLHNRYLHLYAETAFQATLAARGEGIVWRRAGWIGSQRFPGTWAGDTQTTWEAFRCCLRGGLSAGFSSECFWSHDIGGFCGEMPSPELYIRWLQMGMLSPFTRFHGNGLREPWHYGDTAVQVAQYYGQLRYRLIPYLLNLAEEAVADGTPLLRHCQLECEGEPGLWNLDDQYFLGPDLLVAPVQQAGARSRWVYLPRGDWFCHRSGTRYSGGQWHDLAAPLEHLPLLVRGGALIPRYRQAQQHLKEAIPDQLILDVWPSSSERQLHWHFDDGAGRVEAWHESNADGGRIRVQTGGREVCLHLPRMVQLEQGGQYLQTADDIDIQYHRSDC